MYDLLYVLITFLFHFLHVLLSCLSQKPHIELVLLILLLFEHVLILVYFAQSLLSQSFLTVSTHN